MCIYVYVHIFMLYIMLTWVFNFNEDILMTLVECLIQFSSKLEKCSSHPDLFDASKFLIYSSGLGRKRRMCCILQLLLSTHSISLSVPVI